ADLDLPTDRPRPPVPTFRGARRCARLGADLTERLRALGRHGGASLDLLLLAAFQVLLQRYTGQDDVSIGTPLERRSDPETVDAVGSFANLLVLRGDLSGDPTFRELLGRTQDRVHGAYAYRAFPYGRLVEELKPTWDVGRNPLFQVLFTPAAVRDHGLRLPGATVTTVDVDPGLSTFDLSLYVSDDS